MNSQNLKNNDVTAQFKESLNNEETCKNIPKEIKPINLDAKIENVTSEMNDSKILPENNVNVAEATKDNNNDGELINAKEEESSDDKTKDNKNDDDFLSKETESSCTDDKSFKMAAKEENAQRMNNEVKVAKEDNVEENRMIEDLNLNNDCDKVKENIVNAVSNENDEIIANDAKSTKEIEENSSARSAEVLVVLNNVVDVVVPKNESEESEKIPEPSNEILNNSETKNYMD